jgi:hypothetical protein
MVGTRCLARRDSYTYVVTPNKFGMNRSVKDRDV